MYQNRPFQTHALLFEQSIGGVGGVGTQLQAITTINV